MDYRKRLIALVAAMACLPCYAAYSSVSISPKITGSGTARALVRAAANDVAFVGNTVRTTGSLSVGGRAVTMPVSMRIAANAGRVMATAAYLNPALMVVGGAALAYALYTGLGYEVINNQWWEVFGGCGADGCPYWTFRYIPQPVTNPSDPFVQASHYPSLSAAASAFASLSSGCNLAGTRCYAYTVNSVTAPSSASFHRIITYVDNRFIPPQIGTESETDIGVDFDTGMDPGGESALPVSEAQFVEAAENIPISPLVWPSFPIEFPIPIREPVINPAPEPVPEPEALPMPQPLRVPQSEPIPVPDSVPEQWKTPVVDIVPAPTVNDPLRVDLQPYEVIKNNPTPLPESEPVPAPDAETEVKPKPESDQGLCSLFPDILACAKPELDVPDGPAIEQQNRDISITPDSGWGGGGGSCPASRHLAGANVDFSFTQICDGLSKFRPVILAFAWLSAAYILLGMRQGAES